jgi:hypothetical protein
MAFVNDYDVGAALIGVIAGFDTKPGRTGYQVNMLFRGEERWFDVTEEAYQIRFTTAYFPYPVLGEVVFMLEFDSRGIVTKFIDVNDISDGKGPIKTGLVMGTCRMFKKKILSDTPTFGDILDIQGDTVFFKDIDRYKANGELAHCVYGGAMPEPHDGGSFKLAKDVNVYVWDWASALGPFRRCTREEAEALKFVSRFSIGSTADILKNCYWINFYSTRGNEEQIDFIKCFLNKEPGWID